MTWRHRGGWRPRGRHRRGPGASPSTPLFVPEPVTPSRVVSAWRRLARRARSARSACSVRARRSTTSRARLTTRVGTRASAVRVEMACTRARRRSIARRHAASARPSQRSMSRDRSAVARRTSSAALEGVAARTSATKSAMVKSVSWPTPAITGTREATMARATTSSLNAQRSSIEPPPRATMMTSTSSTRASASRARAMSAAAPSPCTRVSRTRTLARGTRANSTFRMSRTAAPSSDVTTPMRRGKGGSARLRCGSKRPSRPSRAFISSKAACRAPRPRGSNCSATS